MEEVSSSKMLLIYQTTLCHNHPQALKTQEMFSVGSLKTHMVIELLKKLKVLEK
jgi:hypothetical protein